jgi:RAB protein geranylgeranyltransferase component A
MTKKDFIKFVKNYLEKLIDLVEQNEDTESADEILEKFKNYGKQN